MSEKKTRIVAEESQYAVIEVRRNEVFPERFVNRVGLTETRRIACATLQNAVVAGVLMFYSRSLLGAVIRACVSA